MAARSEAWVCGLSLAGIVGSNPAESMDVCLFWVLGVVRYRSLRRSDHTSIGVLPTVVCLSVCEFVCVCECVWMWVCECESLSVIRCYYNPLHPQRIGRRGQTEKKRKKNFTRTLKLCLFSPCLKRPTHINSINLLSLTIVVLNWRVQGHWHAILTIHLVR